MKKNIFPFVIIALFSCTHLVAQRLLPDAEKKFNKLERYELGENGEEIPDGEMFTKTNLSIWYDEKTDETLVIFAISAMSGASYNLLHYVEELKNRSGHRIVALHMSDASNGDTQYAILEYHNGEIVSYTRISDGRFYRHTKVD